jgi:hypothetical protein
MALSWAGLRVDEYCQQLLRQYDSPGTWFITPVESTNQSRQVSGTSDASRDAVRAYRDLNPHFIRGIFCHTPPPALIAEPRFLDTADSSCSGGRLLCSNCQGQHYVDIDVVLAFSYFVVIKMRAIG